MNDTPQSSSGKPGLLAPILVVAVILALGGGFWLIDPLGLRAPPADAPSPANRVAEQLANGEIALGKPVPLESVKAGEAAAPPSDLEASAETLAKHRAACDGGAGEECYYAGRQLEIGLGVDQNEILAAELYERACTLGSAKACSSAGAMIMRAASDIEAVKEADGYFARACKLGETQFCE